MTRIYYPEIELSWENKYLKNRSYPQSVRITTPGFLENIQRLLYDYDDNDVRPYFQRLHSFLKQDDKRLTGVMDYKNPLDWMGVYYTRWGMVSCINEKVKSILEKNCADSDYLLKPISVKGVEDPYYVLFVYMLSFEEAGVVFSESEYAVVDRNSSHFGEKIHLNGPEEYRKHQLDYVPKRLCLHPLIKKKGIYFIESCSHIFYAPEIAKSFVANKVSGARIVPANENCILTVLSE